MNLLSKLLILLIISTGLPAHAEYISKPYEINTVLVTFFWFDTYEALQDHYFETFGKDKGDEGPDRLMAGYSGTETYLTHNFCHLDLYAVRSSEVDDDEALTIGHEVLHCVHGPGYHKIR